MNKKKLNLPLSEQDIKALSAGDMVYLSGVIYTGRDAAHKRLCDMIQNGEELPFCIDNAAIFYAGPCPAKPGQVIGSIGPTTSGRMDAYSPLLIQHGMKVMVGKGHRSKEVIAAIKNYGGIYFASVGGAAALTAKCVKSCEIAAFDDLGTEAVRRLVFVDLPVIVAVDCRGADYYDRDN